MNRRPLEICAFICIAAGICVPFAIRCFEGGAVAEYTILATAGDWLGGTSAPLFSLAGFLMMYGAYKMQQEDLRLTREEMQQTREEFKTQNATLKRQEFETTFFHLLELHHQIVNSIVYEQKRMVNLSYTSTIYEGRKYFIFAYNDALKNNYQRYVLTNVPELDGRLKYLSSFQLDLKSLQQAYNDFHREHHQYIGHYFRNIYHILRLLDKSILKDEEKMDFAKLLAAQLSADELHLLFYNCFASDDYKKTRALALHYDMFDTMDKATLLNKEHFQFLNPE